MRNLKELRPILTSLYCINQTGNQDPEIKEILEYAFDQIFNSNTNLITLACIGRKKEDIMGDIKQILHEDTQFEKYLKRKEEMRKYWEEHKND